MSRISITITLIFTLFLIGPTVVSIIDDSLDISIVNYVNEEESNNVSNSFEFAFIDIDSTVDCFDFIEPLEADITYQSLYMTLSLDNSSPPPEYNIF